LCTFGGFAIGGLTGVLTADGNDRIPSMLKGCLIGAIAGFAAGYVVSENMKDTDDNPNPKPDKSRIDEYFKDYQNMNGN
jgi:outer membrane lipoprotein SlyB